MVETSRRRADPCSRGPWRRTREEDDVLGHEASGRKVLTIKNP